MLTGKNVLLAVSAGIAAYKSATLCRLLIKKGANVKVLMTPDSINFITPLTLSTLSKNPVTVDYYNTNNGEWNNHVELAKWADFFLLAPATANTIAKMANGICDNVLLATYFSMENSVFLAPAMDLDMYQHFTVKANLEKLAQGGNFIIPAETGELASGLEGEGRMAEPEHIIQFLEQTKNSVWANKNVLISAGPTYEEIDPVRFIGNHSSGKMGYAIAEEFQKRGAKVTLVSGPTSLSHPKGVEVKSVKSAHEMLEGMKSHSKNADCIIMSAAVADYTPVHKASQKIKKNDASLMIELQKTTDILKWLGEHKQDAQILVGFALETENELENAKKKLVTKNLDLIVLNSLQDSGAGFGYDTNQVNFIYKDGTIHKTDLMSKQEVANNLINEIELKCLG